MHQLQPTVDTLSQKDNDSQASYPNIPYKTTQITLPRELPDKTSTKLVSITTLLRQNVHGNDTAVVKNAFPYLLQRLNGSDLELLPLSQAEEVEVDHVQQRFAVGLHPKIRAVKLLNHLRSCRHDQTMRHASFTITQRSKTRTFPPKTRA